MKEFWVNLRVWVDRCLVYVLSVLLVIATLCIPTTVICGCVWLILQMFGG